VIATKIMTMGLRRAGLMISIPAYTNLGRDMFNLGLKDLVNRRHWLWRDKEGTFNTVDGTRTYSLASDVLRPYRNSWVDETDDNPLIVRDVQDTDWADPDQATKGQIHSVVFTGISSSDGTWQVDLIDTPDSVNIIRYRYEIKAAELNDDGTDDSIDLDLTYPDWVQHAMLLYISAYAKGEEGDDQGQIADLNLFEIQVRKWEDIDIKMARTGRIVLPRADQQSSSVFSILSLSGLDSE
jgi:hypothetical protein